MDRDSELFQALVLQLAQAGWTSLGKIPNPMTGTVDRQLEMARLTIDTLGALETRTKGNLDEGESALLARSIRELRLNYLDELKKPDEEKPESQTTEETVPESSADGEAVGKADGKSDGEAAGKADGKSDGEAVGKADGNAEGDAEGKVVEKSDGEASGHSEKQKKDATESADD